MQTTTLRVLHATMLAAALAMGGISAQAEEPRHGGTLTYIVFPEPPTLTSAVTSSGPVSQVSPKIHDGLLTYGFDLEPAPQLATDWKVAEDGLSIRFDLRSDVTWHDGEPFTSEDVAFSVMEVWRVAHARGRSTFANVVEVETPDPHTAILRLDKPSPYILNALASMESQVVPKHVYEGTDVQTNPNNNAPIGTGPFRFVEWQRGSHLILERNPDYWDAPKPWLDRVIVRFIPDAGARAAALESGEADLLGMSIVPLNDVRRLDSLDHLGVETRGYEYIAVASYLMFNLEHEPFDDPRVRQAVAHALDRDLINRLVWFGYGAPATGPIHRALPAFYTDDVPSYPHDPAEAEELLDAAGLERGPDGVRFRITHDYLPFGEQFVRLAEYVRQALGEIGIEVEIVTQDYATFVRRVYNDRDFHLASFFANNTADPTIGVQRFYWSENFLPGVAFSNGAGYVDEEMDRLLEAAQTEVDPDARRDLFHEMQRLAMTDLPYLPLTHLDMITIYNQRVRNHTITADGVHANFAEVYLVE